MLEIRDSVSSATARGLFSWCFPSYFLEICIWDYDFVASLSSSIFYEWHIMAAGLAR